jgi:putative DNA primase/helicase
MTRALNIDDLIEQEVERPRPSEARIAAIFVEREGENFRYLAPWKQWLWFDGKVWRNEATLLVPDKIRMICQELARDASSNAEVKSLLKRSTISGAEQIARAMRGVAATIDQWDRDPWLLNTPGGVVDLRTGKTRPARREDFMTKITGVAADANCQTPAWDAHLTTVFAGDADLIAHMYRAWGYCLTGDVGEDVLFFGHGKGKNGKSTTNIVIKTILGSYAIQAQMEMFTHKKHSEHTTELTDLFRARLVFATETEQGKNWNESRIKELTGRETIRARRMRENTWEFFPTHKLWFSGNHRPHLRDVGEAIRRRMNLIPFVVIIPEAERREGYEKDLLREAPGILAKMIAGCVAWQRDGLSPPQKVIEATNRYMDEEDSLKQWFEECVVVDVEAKGAFTPALYESYVRWMRRAGNYPLRQTDFVLILEQREQEFGIERAPDRFEINRERGRGFRRIKEVIYVQETF